MGEDLPILKGILNGVVKYHNARRYLLYTDIFHATNYLSKVLVYL